MPAISPNKPYRVGRSKTGLGLFATKPIKKGTKIVRYFGPLLDSWKAMTVAHQQEMQNIYAQTGEQAAEQYKSRLENVSNQWMLATVASLDHQSREMISGIAATAEEKLREACAQVFAGVGESLRERLREMAQSFAPPMGPPGQAKSATTSA